MIRGRAVIMGALTLAMLWAPAPVWACSCIQATDARQFARADVVFIGVAVERSDPNEDAEIRSTGDPIRTTFEVRSVQKGTVGDRVRVTSARGGATCGFAFGIGGRYQVFAARDDDGLTTNLCSGTRWLAQATAHQPPGGSGQHPITGLAGMAAAAAFLAAAAGGIAVLRARR